jgi:hypothetical protein
MYKAPRVSHLELEDTTTIDHNLHHPSHHYLSPPSHSQPTTMKVNTLSAATLALLTQTVLGDFSIYTQAFKPRTSSTTNTDFKSTQ